MPRFRYPDLNAFIREDWEAGFLESWDANDMVTLINTWQQGDISLVRHGGDYEKCLSEITAKGLIMPCKTDLYFPVRLIDTFLPRHTMAGSIVAHEC